MITEIDEKGALVLIDLQQGIAHGTVHPVEEVIANSVRLVEAFHERGLPVVLVTVNPIGAAFLSTRIEGVGSNRTKLVLPDNFDELVPQIPVTKGDIRVRKRHWNAFFETGLHEQLQKLGVTQIVLGGIATSIGVEGTARSASEFGYNLAFATDAMSDRTLEAHGHSLKFIFPRLGELGTTDELIARLPASKLVD